QLPERLDGDHACPRPDECPRELPRPGGHVDDGPARAKVEPLREPRDRLGRVLRSRPLVRIGDAVEAGGGTVEAQYAPRRARTAGIVFTRIVMSSQIDQFSR